MTITLYFLQASRSIRIAWLLEELGLPWECKFYWRENNKAPQAYRDECESPMGKAPVLRDGDTVVYESGAIVEYIAAKYDPTHRIIPEPSSPQYPDVLQWVHAAEGQVALHGLAILYANWMSPPALRSSPDFDTLVTNLGAAVQRDFDWVDKELAKNEGGFLVGDKVTGADIMMQFSVRFLIERGFGTKGKTWKHINAWLEKCESTESYKNAIKKSGHSLDNQGNKA